MKGTYKLVRTSKQILAERDRHNSSATDAFRKRHARIMLMGCDQPTCESIRTLLSREADYDLLWLKNVNDFLDALEIDGVWPPDVLLLETSSMLAEYKEQLMRVVRELDTPPIILISRWTATHLMQVVERSQLPQDKVLPFDMQTLLSSIDQVLRSRVPADSTA